MPSPCFGPVFLADSSSLPSSTWGTFTRPTTKSSAWRAPLPKRRMPSTPDSSSSGPEWRAGQRQPDRAVDLFEAAIATFGPDDPFLDRALLHHAYGRLLSAQGSRRAAVDHLRAARDLLVSVGAEPFVARVDADLAATGLHGGTRSSTRSTLDLTDRERNVAFLVAQGLTNPEVAAQLYVSRKAVEYHLSNIYAKLGVRGRRDLRTRCSFQPERTWTGGHRDIDGAGNEHLGRTALRQWSKRRRPWHPLAPSLIRQISGLIRIHRGSLRSQPLRSTQIAVQPVEDPRVP